MTENRGSIESEIPAHREPWRHLLVLFAIGAVLLLLSFLLFGALERGL